MNRTLPDSEPVRPWVEAAGGLWLSRLFAPVPGDAEALFLQLLTLARAQYGAELAHSRLQATSWSPEPSALQRIELTLAQAADVHAFLVSAALYWWTLREAVEEVKEPDLRPMLAAHESAASIAKLARDHIEHLNERIAGGRRPKYGTSMPVEAFRTAVGAFDGKQITFGTETFLIDEMLGAIRGSSESIAPPLRDALEPQLEVRLDGPGP